jgi:crotonobetainyl-CoA:carnitine CoA-transferase CaiB-like acyl-CoA transferase
MSRPLEGIRVVDIGISTAGPFGARLLGDLGADVIKIEPLDGENTRSLGLRYGDMGYLFHVNNYNKRSVTLQVQIRAAAGLPRLVAHSYGDREWRSGRWTSGIATTPAAASTRRSYCSVKGFANPARCGNCAFDTVTQALSGSCTQRASRAIRRLGRASACDLMGGVVDGGHRGDRGPAGAKQFVDTALFDMGAFALTALWPLAQQRPAEALRSIGNGHPLHAPFGDHACADGRVMLTVTSRAQWRALAPLLGLDPVWDRAQRRAQAAAIDAALARWFAARGAAGGGRLQRLGVPAAPIRDLASVTASAAAARAAWWAR